MTMPDPKVINAQFWTDWQADYIAGAVTRRDEAAGRLVTATGWFWTVYTTIALVGTALAKRTSLHGWHTVVVLLPVATLLISYLLALWTLNPIVGHTEQTSREAKELWRRVLAVKSLRLQLASAMLLVSAALIVLAGLLVASSH